MSEVFEGVVFHSKSEQRDSRGNQPGLISVVLEGDVVAIFRNDARSQSAFTAGMDDLAANLSMTHGQALVVRYDSRLGHRSSVLFVGGQRVREYGATDELYVPLDEDGEPLRSSPPVLRSDFENGQEYETLENAIQRGLRDLGRGNWDSLFALMTSRA